MIDACQRNHRPCKYRHAAQHVDCLHGDSIAGGADCGSVTPLTAESTEKSALTARATASRNATAWIAANWAVPKEEEDLEGPPRCNLFDELKPFDTVAVIKCQKTRGVPPGWARQWQLAAPPCCGRHTQYHSCSRKVSDPVGAGFVRTTRVQGGNVTGFSQFESVASKWIEKLKEIAPEITRVGSL